MGLAVTAALALFPEPQAGSALLPTLVIFPTLPAPATVAVEAAPTLDFGLMHAIGLATLAAGLLALGRLMQLAAHAVALRRFRRTLSAPADPGLQRRARRLSRHVGMGLRRRVRVVCTSQPVTPMTFGFAQPVIVLPEALAADDERLRTTLAHELVHIRRGDYLAQAIEQVITAFFVVHPLVHALRRSAASWRERACDAAVLEDARFRPHRYAALLRDLALAAPARQAVTVALTESPNHLKTRIEAMTDYRKTVRRFLSPKRAGLLLGAMLLVVAAGIVACTEMVDPNEMPTAEVPTPQMTADGEVFMVVEEMPEIVGGMQAIYENLEYPTLAQKAGIEGTVYVQFTIDEEGHVIDPVIMKSPDEILSKAALEAVKKLEFEPGQQDGKTVKVRMSLPIRFELDGASDKKTSEAQKRANGGAFVVLEDMPQIKGGMMALYDVVTYPEMARKAGIEGTVYVQFTVDEEGNVVNPTVAKGVHELLDRAALETIRQLKFKPGMQDGEPARVRMTLPIRFELRDGETETTTDLQDDKAQDSVLPPVHVVGYPGAGEEKETSSLTPPGLLEGQVDIGPIDIKEREMLFRNLEFSGNTVTGRVVDAATGQPLAGANIVVPATHKGGFTHADGSFTIHADAPIEGIIASFIGYERVKAQQ